jgi:hypothetical protein
MEAELKKLSVKQEKQPDSKSNISELLDYNSLRYSLPYTNSLISRRSQQNFQFDSTQYGTNSQPSVTWQTGHQFVNCRNSYLILEITVEGSAAPASNASGTRTLKWSWGNGSALNLFSEVVVNSRSGGQTLDRVGANNLYRLMKHKLEFSDEQYASVGARMGYGLTDTLVSASTKHKFIIPLSELAPIYDTYQLMPDVIASGQRLTLSLEDPNTAIKWTAFNGSSADTAAVLSGLKFTLHDMKIVCDCHTLQDAAYRSVSLASAKSGLEFCTKSVHHESFPFQNRFNASITKAVARSLDVLSVPRLDAKITSQKDDSLVAISDVNYDKYQVRIGSHYLPATALTDNKEIFMQNLYSADKLQEHDVKLDYTEWKANYGFILTNCQTQSMLEYSGVSVNNSRQILLEGNVVGGAGKTMDVFMTYMKVIRGFKNNIAITS